MTILVPTDFSPAAEVALRYAVMLAQKFTSRIILLHAIPRHSVRLEELDKDLMAKAGHKLTTLKDQLTNDGLDEKLIDVRVINEFPLDAVIRAVASDQHADLIVIGSKGASGLRKTLLGSFAADVIEDTSLPVIAVPLCAPTEGVSNIVYATDLLDTIHELETLLPYARLFNATIHMLHIQKPDRQQTINETDILTQAQNRTGYEKITFTLRTSDEFDEVIDQFLAEKGADLLAMFTQNKNFFERLFSRSHTEEICYHTRVPLFAFHK